MVFTLFHKDTHCSARRGQLTLPHGTVQTPCFMPVGTLGTVKGVELSLLENTGSEIILGNTYHLSLRPGEDVVKDLGGLHNFCGWQKPILTDSGGFQVFSLAKIMKIDEYGAVFRSHIDGSKIDLTPERSIEIQQALGSDIMMVLDHVIGLPNERKNIEDAMQRTVRWAERCKRSAEKQAPPTANLLFSIVQGGLEPDLRKRCAKMLTDIGFDGYAVGGLSVGETPQEMYDALDYTLPHLPEDRPRYLMGVGKPIDILNGILRGVDMFDCVMPTRNGRNAQAFTDAGPLRLRNEKYKRDDRPLEEHCPCPACKRSRAYLRHLFIAEEMLGPILLTVHNITYYQCLVQRARHAVEQNRFLEFYNSFSV
ncbi:MAG: tRNA guanosine(34) transglycosylase Tgt [Planctomycetaceae bacterium]|jgi:queuine tRNA-ribosyltransferase|nr:tRNA guanosine(34) transglycosylase Tgt [Planctomycetaceae bacterium]